MTEPLEPAKLPEVNDDFLKNLAQIANGTKELGEKQHSKLHIGTLMSSIEEGIKDPEERIGFIGPLITQLPRELFRGFVNHEFDINFITEIVTRADEIDIKYGSDIDGFLREVGRDLEKSRWWKFD